MKSPPLQTLRAKPLVYKARFFVATREAVGGGGGDTDEPEGKHSKGWVSRIRYLGQNGLKK